MEIPVLIEPVNKGGFRARCGEPLSLTAEAATRDEAIANLRDRIAACMADGRELVTVPVEGSPPMPGGAGIFKDDPMFDEWQAAIAEYRRAKDEQEDIE